MSQEEKVSLAEETVRRWQEKAAKPGRASEARVDQ
jgi:hypothetical protein